MWAKMIGMARAAPSGEGSLLDLVDEEGPEEVGRLGELVRSVEKGLGGLNVIKRERQTTLKQLKDAVFSELPVYSNV